MDVPQREKRSKAIDKVDTFSSVKLEPSQEKLCFVFAGKGFDSLLVVCCFRIENKNFDQSRSNYFNLKLSFPPCKY